MKTVKSINLITPKTMALRYDIVRSVTLTTYSSTQTVQHHVSYECRTCDYI